MDTEAIITRLGERLHEANARCGTELSLTPHYPPIPPFETNLQGDLVRTLVSASGQSPGTVAFGTEGHFLQSLGMETVIFGPGSIDQAHQPNEYLALEQIGSAKQVLCQVIDQYCMN